MRTATDAHAALARALANQHSSFYRDLYARKGFDAHHAPWGEVPMLTKQDIIATPAAERFFLPMSQTESITFTSGTSGKGIVVVPRRLPPPSAPGRPLYPGAALMTFFYYSYTSVCVRGANTQHIISGDSKRPAQSAALAEAMEVDALQGPPAAMLAFAAHLSPELRARIMHLNFEADRLSRVQQGVLHELFPNAAHHNMYASRELGPILYTQPEDTDPFLLSASPDLYLEILAGDKLVGLDAAPADTEGELVATTLTEVPFPYMRYRTGDRVRLHATQNGGPLLEVLGRAEEERVRIPGGELVLRELERAIIASCGTAVTDFECAVVERRQGDSVVTGIELALIGHAVPTDAAERLARELRVSTARTWHDGVERGLYAPIATVEPSVHDGKRKNLLDRRA